jgi:hypothetical protein
MKGDLRCVEGRLFRHDPQSDDPYLETDVGQCPDCEGDGCPCDHCDGTGSIFKGDFIDCPKCQTPKAGVQS